MKLKRRAKRAEKHFNKAFKHLEKTELTDFHQEKLPVVKVTLSHVIDMCKELSAGVGGGVVGDGSGGTTYPGGNAGTLPPGGSPMAPGPGGLSTDPAREPMAPGPGGMTGSGATVSPDGGVGYMGLQESDEPVNPGYPSSTSPDGAAGTTIAAMGTGDLGTIRASFRDYAKCYDRVQKCFKHVSAFYCHEVVRQQGMAAAQRTYGLLDQIYKDLYGGLTTDSEPRV